MSGFIKGGLATAAVACGVCISTQAQVIHFSRGLLGARMSRVKATVVDSLTNEPIAFASVYLIPENDTTISNFTLSGEKGEASLEEIPFGGYSFRVEMMGYKPHASMRYFREAREDIGIIRLQTDEQFITAATVSATGNPITIKQDTVVFNAGAFAVGSNAMLRDLLKRMPGMEVTDGKVKFNGESIDKLTVGGRTFFFDNQAMALNNLPAAIVDKISIIDRESEEIKAGGVNDGGKEKVLDVGLKKEYQDGFFGNVSIAGGGSLDDRDDPLRYRESLLYNTNFLVAAYNPKDQLTVVGNAQKPHSGDGMTVIYDDGADPDVMATSDISAGAGLGANFTTTRINGLEGAASASYNYLDGQSGRKSTRTTWQDSGTLLTESGSSSHIYSNSIGGKAEIRKDKGDFTFLFMPSLKYSDKESYSSQYASTEHDGLMLNESEGFTHKTSIKKGAELFSNVTFSNIAGKKRRALNLSFRLNYEDSYGDSDEKTLLKTAAATDNRLLHYDSDADRYGYNVFLNYSEPVSSKLRIITSGRITYSRNNYGSDAYDANGRNDYYSSSSDNRYFNRNYSVVAEYGWAPGSNLNVGINANGILNEIYSVAYNLADTTGKGETAWIFGPTVSLYSKIGKGSIQLRINGGNRRASNSQMRATLDISNPSSLSFGNIYLRPYGNWESYILYRIGNPARFSSLMASATCKLKTNPLSTARWYDDSGILHSIPINDRKSDFSGSGFVSYNTSVGHSRKWFVTLNGRMAYSHSGSWLATGTLPAIDKEHFDYMSFMGSFWGDKDGNIFYGGGSGFKRSTTSNMTPGGSINLKYTGSNYSVSAGTHVNGLIARSSLNPSIDMNTLNAGFSLLANCSTKSEWNFDSDLDFTARRGYARGYNRPEWNWNAEISKNVKAFNISIRVNDILNQTRGRNHIAMADYVEDSYSMVRGRYMLVGIRWNFGKMNAAQSNKAERAALGILGL